MAIESENLNAENVRLQLRTLAGAGGSPRPDDWQADKLFGRGKKMSYAEDAAAEAAKRAELIASLGLKYSAVFVPQSQSRNAGEKQPSLNWRVTIARGNSSITTDYMQGIAHRPGYEQLAVRTLDVEADDILAAEQGKYRKNPKQRYNSFANYNAPIPAPQIDDVLYSLLMDADVLNYPRFEDWAPEIGLDPDSRKAETMYRACLTIALQLRAMLTDENMKELRDSFEGY